MSQRQHLRRRVSGFYVVRLIVPLALRAVVGTREVQRSTGCRDLALAKIVAADMASTWHARIAQLRHMDPRKLTEGSVNLLGDGKIPLTEAAAILGGSAADLCERLVRRNARVFVEARAWSGWWLDSLYDLDREIDEVGNLVAVDVTDSELMKHGQARTLTRLLELHRLAS